MKLNRLITTASVVVGTLSICSTSLAAEPAEGFAVLPDALEENEAPELIDQPEHALEIAVVPRGPETIIRDRQEPAHLGDWTLYVHFDGGTLGSCSNSSPHDNCSSIFPGTVLPYSGDEGKRASIIQLLRKRFEDFGISVTNVRPESGDYDMEMVGDWQGVNNPGFAGIAPGGDCWNNAGGEISFTLEASGTTDGMAEIILQEVGHTWGLDHVDDKTDLLYPTTEGQNKIFQDQCLQVVANTDLDPTSGHCSHHQEACGTFSQQNSYRELLLIFGESVPDTAAPVVQILSPADGDVIEGDSFELVVGFEDDQKPAVILSTITIDSDALDAPIENDGAFASPAELSFPVSGLPGGTFTITVDGRDESDNPASDSVTITLDQPSNGSSADGTGSGSGGPTSDSGTDTAGDSEDADSDTAGGSDTDGVVLEDGSDNEGCACRAAPHSPSASWWLLGVGLVATRRRRIRTR